jgi:outer membrane protein assembly factor BamB
VFTPGASATENSLIAIDDTIVVENNYGYAPAVTSTMAGRSTQPGVAAIRAVDGECEPAWTNNGVHVPSLVSKATTKAGLMLTYTKPPDSSGVDAWYFTALDVRTGDTVWTRLAGTGVSFNNHYAAAYLGPDGSMYVGTLSGIAALRP